MNEGDYKEFLSLTQALGLETLGEVETFAKAHNCFGKGQNENLLKELRKELTSRRQK